MSSLDPHDNRVIITNKEIYAELLKVKQNVVVLYTVYPILLTVMTILLNKL